MTKWDKPAQDAARKQHKMRALLDAAQWMVDHAEEILDMADSRHDDGFDTYGDEMYTWDKRTLVLNIMQEMADIPNYCSALYAKGWKLP